MGHSPQIHYELCCLNRDSPKDPASITGLVSIPQGFLHLKGITSAVIFHTFLARFPNPSPVVVFFLHECSIKT